MDVLNPKNFEGRVVDWLRAVPPLTNNTAKTSFDEDLVKIRPAIAELSRQKKEEKKHRTATKT